MRKLILFFLLVISASMLAEAQNVGIGTAAPNASALLDLVSGTKGFRLPQVALDSLKDILSIPSPANGLMVFNTTTPGVLNDMQRGIYYYNTNAVTWIRMSDNFNDNAWQQGGILGLQLRDKTDAVEIMDTYAGTQTAFSPKVKILRSLDSATLNSKNNITALVLSGVERKTTAGWDTRQKTTLVFENNYVLANSTTSASNATPAISGYTENTSSVNNNQTNGLAFYVTAPPQNAAVADTASMSLFRHNVCIGDYATDINNVTEGRLQIKGFGNGDQLSLRHSSSIILKWGLYVSSIDSSLNFYSNGSLRSNIDRVTGVYTALSDRKMKKNLAPLTPVLNAVMKLPAYTYQYLDGEPGGRRSIGFMAQDVQPYFPELVYQRYDREVTKPVLAMDYSGFGIIAVKAVQEQQKLIEDLQKKVEASNTSVLLDIIKKQQDVIYQLSKRIELLEKK